MNAFSRTPRSTDTQAGPFRTETLQAEVSIPETLECEPGDAVGEGFFRTKPWTPTALVTVITAAVPQNFGTLKKLRKSDGWEPPTS